MEFRDPTHGGSEPGRYWTTVNIGEAMPDVLSPMCWSFWGPGLEAAARLAYYDFGILGKDELAVPTAPDELMVSYFFGRPAMNMDLLRVLFGAMPGMTADDFERDICGKVRPGLPPTPKRGRAAHVMARSPKGMATAGRRLRDYAADQRAWWEAEVLDGGGLADPGRLLTGSYERFKEAFRRHVHGRFVLMPVQAQLTKLAEDAGRPDLINRVMGGLGGVTETALADDLWQVGRGTLDTDRFLRRFGFHGPNEGNLDGWSWRENDSTLGQMAKAMADRPVAQRPRTREAAMMQARQGAVAELVSVLPRARQPVARLLCKAAVRRVQDNEIGKASFLMALDGGRAATRALGRRLRDEGRLEDVEDAFYLTIDELLAPDLFGDTPGPGP
ncbi:MAG: PEP-utilizing enzyme, partial [Acidimicrobiia bacterium]